MKTIIGRKYQVLEKLGEGMNGEVYLVLDIFSKKKWAAKGVRKLFENEIIALSVIDHNAFPKIHDVIFEADKCFMIIEYIDGSRLDLILKEQRLSSNDISRLILQLAEAIYYLHNRPEKMLYLDCKPENIIIDSQGNLHMVDMGSIYMCYRNSRDFMNSMGNILKQQISGTVGYAAPEQRRGRYVDMRSDIYAFGKTIMTMLHASSFRFTPMGHQIKLISHRCSLTKPRLRYQDMNTVIRALSNTFSGPFMRQLQY